MSLDYLFNGAPPPAVTTTTAQDSGLPAWYQDYLRGIAGKATDIAGQQSQQYAPRQLAAGMNTDDFQAHASTLANQGSWQPGMAAATNTVNGLVPGVTGYGNSAIGATTNYGAQAGQAAEGYGSGATGAAQAYGSQATGAVAGNPMNWQQSWKGYMSPYTQNVVDNIARLGTRNFNENIMPGVDAAMIGSGQFGSTRNADVLARAGRDASADITGQQSQALQSGYGMAADIYSGDASRLQQQQQLRSAAALGAGQNVSQAYNTAGQTVSGALNQAGGNIGNVTNAAGRTYADATLGASQQQGALAQANSALGYTDANAQYGLADRTRGIQQNAYNTSYNNDLNQSNWDWNILNNVNGAIRGMPINTTPTTAYNGPAQVYQPGALQTTGAVH